MSQILAALILLTISIVGSLATSIQDGMEAAMHAQREQLERMSAFLGPDNDGESFSLAKAKRQGSGSTITFANPAAEQFFVDGTTIPDGSSIVTSSFCDSI